MKFKIKKVAVFLFISLAIMSLAGFLFYQKNKNNELLNIYHNQTYSYSFQYPKYLKQENHCSGNDDPVFLDENPQSFEADAISVVTSPTIFANLDQWLEKENEYWQKHDQKRVVEKRLKIDGNKALVTYLEGSYPNSEISNQSQVAIEKGQGKKTVFIKNNVLFEINSRFIADPVEQQNIWHSFKIADFTKPNISSVSEGLYVNHKYSYSLNYGDNLRIDEFCFGDDSNVSLSSTGINLPFNLVHIVVLENSSFKTIKQWQLAENAKSDISYQKFERNVLIDNHPAQVFYESSQYEDFPYNKKTVFIKDNNLFIISTYFGEEKNHQTVWDNFKFIENNLGQIENWDLYQEINKQSLGYDIFGDPNECAQVEGFNQEFAKFKDVANHGSVKQFLYAGVLDLVITPNYNNWSNDKFLAFSTDNGAFCGMGGFFPLHAYSDKLLWSAGCGPKTFSEEDISDSTKCEEIKQATSDYLKVK